MPSNFYQVPTEVRQANNFGRNTRLRRTASQPVPTSANLQAWNSSNSNVQPTSQYPVTLTSLATAPVLANPAMQQQTVQVSNSLKAPLPSRYWNGTTMSRVGPSISRYQTLLRQEDNLRNNRRNMMISLANMQANLNLANENSNFIGNVASPSRIQSGPGMHLPYSSIRSPHPNMIEQYRKRLQHISNPSDPWRQGNNNPIHSGASLVVQGMNVSVRDGNPRRAQLPLRLGPRAEGQAGHNYRLSSTEQSQTAAQRSRPISEVRNALGHVRRHGGLRPEELQNLEEQIGNFGTGLSEEAILGNLGRQKYQSIKMGPPAETEPCCICQEDYANGEELGKLDCGHDFHFSCIKQWLVQKNSCPICKKTALAI
ncbi:probable E3 ubiquitin-protein ligase HIP1 [Gossypium arboreum]|uniref:probable E3 ubiquitin-protein ligase HIP1 n=1 Tax=Gossypium arboreum TaxID=29729 RepID=UPI0022F17B21|nr:probable E3 ubiquitin-protein ligase HIP1 [Gossypium arboreum]